MWTYIFITIGLFFAFKLAKTVFGAYKIAKKMTNDSISREYFEDKYRTLINLLSKSLVSGDDISSVEYALTPYKQYVIDNESTKCTFYLEEAPNEYLVIRYIQEPLWPGDANIKLRWSLEPGCSQEMAATKIKKDIANSLYSQVSNNFGLKI